ncbi:hypothetical protein COCCADRAFT_107452, partial [Bipolaris zeicola 26-R-13]
PVRSSLVKQFTGGLVARWVTTGESPLSYVFGFDFLLSDMGHVGGFRRALDPRDYVHVYSNLEQEL